MSFAVKLPTATFNTSLKGIRLPSRKKLVGEYMLGGSQAESVKNRANPALPLTVQGAPTYNTNSVTLRSSVTAGFGFKSGIVPATDATIIVVRKNPAISSQPYFVADASRNYGLRENTGTNYSSNGEGAVIRGANRAKPADGVIYFEALTLDFQNAQLATGGLGRLYYYSAGVQQVATSGFQNITGRRPTLELCIGSDSLSDTITTNTFEIFFVALYQRPLTAAEIDAAYQAIVAYYASRSVTVV